MWLEPPVALRSVAITGKQVRFNGARLHQKVFEERFLQHADRLGYLVRGEFGDWGCNTEQGETTNQQPGASYVQKWLEVLERDYSRPVLDTSGYAHRVTESDVFDTHDYEQDLVAFAAGYTRLAGGDPYVTRAARSRCARPTRR